MYEGNFIENARTEGLDDILWLSRDCRGRSGMMTALAPGLPQSSRNGDDPTALSWHCYRSTLYMSIDKPRPSWKAVEVEALLRGRSEQEARRQMRVAEV